MPNCIGGVRELYADECGRPCFRHDRFFSERDLHLVGGTGYKGAIMSGSLNKWDSENEVAWCPEERHTHLRDVQGVCRVLNQIDEGSIDAFTTAQHRCNSSKEIDTFSFRFVSDHKGCKMKKDSSAHKWFRM